MAGPAPVPAQRQGMWASLIGHAVAGWAICGVTVTVGRQFIALESTLIVHAVVAPLAFGLLVWHHFKWYPGSSPAVTALAMLLIVMGLDALIVAPLFEHSYAMFSSILGTWIPFASIFAASFVAGRLRSSARL